MALLTAAMAVVLFVVLPFLFVGAVFLTAVMVEHFVHYLKTHLRHV